MGQGQLKGREKEVSDKNVKDCGNGLVESAQTEEQQGNEGTMEVDSSNDGIGFL